MSAPNWKALAVDSLGSLLTLAAQSGPSAERALASALREIANTTDALSLDKPEEWECRCEECHRDFIVIRSRRQERLMGLPGNCPPCHGRSELQEGKHWRWA